MGIDSINGWVDVSLSAISPVMSSAKSRVLSTKCEYTVCLETCGVHRDVIHARPGVPRWRNKVTGGVEDRLSLAERRSSPRSAGSALRRPAIRRHVDPAGRLQAFRVALSLP